MRPALGAILLALIAAAPVPAQTDPIASLQAAADQGVLAAELELARRYEEGDGLLQNFARAAEWYARAAEAGSAEAANRLGRLHHAGLGVPQDLPRAIALLERAAESGRADFVHDLALVLETSASGNATTLERAAALYRQAAEAGHVEAAVSLGVLLQDGRGVDKDAAAAADLYRGAAEQGHARAQNNLGLLYVRGDGLAQDYGEAARLFKAAAAQGLPEALTNLGVLYENGFGVPQSDEIAADLYRQGGEGERARTREAGLVYDPRLAPPPADEAGLRALEKAAQAGDPVAEFQTAWLLLNTEPREPRRTLQGAILMRRAAEAGHAPAMANLALLYFEGLGLPQDFVLGQMWLVLAGSSGFDRAAEISALWTRRMTADQINEAQERAQALWTARGALK